LSDRFPVADACNSDWIFVPEATQIENQEISAPVVGGGDCQQGAIRFDGLPGIAHGQDFRGILFGDCTGNWSTSSGGARTALSSDAPQIFAGKLHRGRNGKLWLPLYVRTSVAFSSLQVSLRFNDATLALTGARAARRVDSGAVISHSTTRPGTALVALASPESISAGRVILVEFEALGRHRSVGSVSVSGGVVDEQTVRVGRHRGARD
jgi:hypothetical protein